MGRDANDEDLGRIYRPPFGERLKALRKIKKLSQDDLALKAGVAQATVSRAEKGLSTDFLLYEKILLALGFRVLVQKAPKPKIKDANGA